MVLYGPHLKIGSDDLQRVSKEVDPLCVRPHLFHSREVLRALELEEEMGVSILNGPHESEHSANHPLS